MKTRSKYMRHLPSIYQEGGKDEEAPFIEGYLSIFEAMLTGVENSELKGEKSLGEVLDIISDIFYPRFSFLQTGEDTDFLPRITDEKREVFNSYFSVDMDEFLTWMAGWMSLVLKEDWDFEKKREVIARIIPIYKMRGTKEGLERYLQIYAGKDTSVYEFLEPFQVGVTSTVGEDSIIGEGRPYYFQVNMTLPIPDPDILDKEEQAIRDVIEMEKPAHTDYDLIIQVPTLEIGTHSTVGVDTLLGGLITRQN